MMTAIDFGCYAIRSAYRDPRNHKQLNLISERSEYVVLPGTDACRESLASRRIAHAECEGSVVVFGNQARDVRWMSRKPTTPLFAGGLLPTSDAPARQILNVLTQSLLPTPTTTSATCCFTVPGGSGQPRTAAFLARLIQMCGFTPIPCSVTEATMLASGNEHHFTGVTVCMGTEVSQISVSRFGVELRSTTVGVGASWIDTELARQLKIRVWDDAGQCYLDLDTVRAWKQNSELHLRRLTSERDRTLSMLYGAALDRIAAGIRQLIQSEPVTASLRDHRLAVVCSGGPTGIGGFAGALTERLVDQNIGSRVQCVRVADQASTAVVRGLLIVGELEARRNAVVEYAA